MTLKKWIKLVWKSFFISERIVFTILWCLVSFQEYFISSYIMQSRRLLTSTRVHRVETNHKMENIFENNWLKYNSAQILYLKKGKQLYLFHYIAMERTSDLDLFYPYFCCLQLLYQTSATTLSGSGDLQHCSLFYIMASGRVTVFVGTK